MRSTIIDLLKSQSDFSDELKAHRVGIKIFEGNEQTIWRSKGMQSDVEVNRINITNCTHLIAISMMIVLTVYSSICYPFVAVAMHYDKIVNSDAILINGGILLVGFLSAIVAMLLSTNTEKFSIKYEFASLYLLVISLIAYITSFTLYSEALYLLLTWKILSGLSYYAVLTPPVYCRVAVNTISDTSLSEWARILLMNHSFDFIRLQTFIGPALSMFFLLAPSPISYYNSSILLRLFNANTAFAWLYFFLLIYVISKTHKSITRESEMPSVPRQQSETRHQPKRDTSMITPLSQLPKASDSVDNKGFSESGGSSNDSNSYSRDVTIDDAQETKIEPQSIGSGINYNSMSETHKSHQIPRNYGCICNKYYVNLTKLAKLQQRILQVTWVMLCMNFLAGVFYWGIYWNGILIAMGFDLIPGPRHLWKAYIGIFLGTTVPFILPFSRLTRYCDRYRCDLFFYPQLVGIIVGSVLVLIAAGLFFAEAKQAFSSYYLSTAVLGMGFACILLNCDYALTLLANSMTKSEVMEKGSNENSHSNSMANLHENAQPDRDIESEVDPHGKLTSASALLQQTEYRFLYCHVYRLFMGVISQAVSVLIPAVTLQLQQDCRVDWIATNEHNQHYPKCVVHNLDLLGTAYITIAIFVVILAATFCTLIWSTPALCNKFSRENKKEHRTEVDNKELSRILYRGHEMQWDIID